MSEAVQALRKALDLPGATIQVRRQVFPRRVIDLVAVFPDLGEIIVPLYPSQARELGDACLSWRKGWT